MAQAKLQIVIQARDEASRKLKGVGASLGKLKGAISPLLPVLGVVGLTGAFVGVIKSASAFESQMTDISTLLSGDSTQAIEQFKDGIFELLKVIPKDANELGAAAYQIVSAGISDTSEALKVLKSSSRLAVAGLGSVEEATDLVTSALNAFGISTDESERVAGILFNTVKAGKTTVAELAQSFGMVAPIAAEMGVSLEELQASTAALTTVGLKASVAQTQLRAAMASLLKPTKEAKELFDSLGIVSFKQLIVQSGGLVGAFGQLREATKGNEEQFAKALGSVEGLNAALALTSGDVKDAYVAAMRDMQFATENLDEAFQKQLEAFDKQVQLLKNELNVLMVKLGLKIIPGLVMVMKGLPSAIDTLFVKPFKAVVNVLSEVFFWFIKVENKLNEIQDKVFGFIGRVGGTIGGAVGRVGGLLGFAQGGVVPGPTGAARLAVVHGGESILPPGRMGRNIVINLTGTFLSEDAAEEMGNLIIEKLKSQLRF